MIQCSPSTARRENAGASAPIGLAFLNASGA